MGEVLEYPNRVVGTEYRHGAGKANLLGFDRRRRQHNRRGRHHEVGPVVFADGEDVQPELVGQFNFFHQVHHPLVRADELSGRGVGCVFDEGADSYFHN